AATDQIVQLDVGILRCADSSPVAGSMVVYTPMGGSPLW
ncbi:hypothetical protein AHiyo6_23530, partial [Arthrobacter sp. Hiyo6]